MKLNQFLIFSAFVLAGNTTVFAQALTIDHRQMTVDTVGLMGDIQFNLDFNNNASTQAEDKNFLGLKAISNISYFTKKHHFFLKSQLSHFRFNNSSFANKGYSHLRVNFMHENKFAPEAFAQINFDQLRKLNMRHISGVGVRYIFVKNENTEMEAGTAAAFEHEDWEDFVTAQTITKNLIKSSSYLALYKIVGNFGLSMHGLFQTGYDGDINRFRNRVTGYIDLNNFINKHLTLVIRFESHYDALPIVPIKEFTYSVSNAIKLHF